MLAEHRELRPRRVAELEKRDRERAAKAPAAAFDAAKRAQSDAEYESRLQRIDASLPGQWKAKQEQRRREREAKKAAEPAAEVQKRER